MAQLSHNLGSSSRKPRFNTSRRPIREGTEPEPLSRITLKGNNPNLDDSKSLERLATVWLGSARPNLDELMLSRARQDCTTSHKQSQVTSLCSPDHVSLPSPPLALPHSRRLSLQVGLDLCVLRLVLSDLGSRHLPPTPSPPLPLSWMLPLSLSYHSQPHTVLSSSCSLSLPPPLQYSALPPSPWPAFLIEDVRSGLLPT
jgi:hypothetical protein